MQRIAPRFDGHIQLHSEESVRGAEETTKEIDIAREEYRPVATRGSLLYFLIVDMAAINNMYMVSLQQFLELFDFSIDNSDKAPLASKRIVNIIEYLTFYVTCYMQRGLYERHKLIWVLMLAMKIESVADRLSAAYIGCLLKGGGALDAKAEKAKPHDWLPENVWMNCIAVSRTVQMLRDMPDSIARENTKDAWKEWYDHQQPESEVLPGDWHDKPLTTSPSSVQISVGTSPAGSVTFNLAPAESVLLYVSGARPSEFTIRPAAGERKYFNWWGMHEGGAGRD